MIDAQLLPFLIPIDHRIVLADLLASCGGDIGRQRPLDGIYPVRLHGLDLVMRPDPPDAPPTLPDRPMWRSLFTDWPQASAGWLAIGLGPDCTGGYGLAALFRPFLAACLQLADAARAPAAGWRPARLMTATGVWHEQVNLFAAHGHLPVLPLVAIDRDGDWLSSRGLDALLGEELAFDARDLAPDDRARHFIRLLVDRYRAGPYADGTEVADAATGLRWCVRRTDRATRFDAVRPSG